MLFDLYVVFIFVLYYGSLVNTITILSIFNYLHKFDGRVLKSYIHLQQFLYFSIYNLCKFLMSCCIQMFLICVTAMYIGCCRKETDMAFSCDFFINRLQISGNDHRLSGKLLVISFLPYFPAILFLPDRWET